MLVWLLQCSDAVVNRALGLQLASGQQMGKRKVAPATDGRGNPNLFPTQDRDNALTLPGDHKCEGEQLIFLSGTARKDGSALSGWCRKGRAMVGFQGRTVFSSIPHFTACFWHKTAQVYFLAVYIVRSPMLKRNQRKEQGERHTSTPEQPRQKCKLIKMMMMLIIIWYVK